MYLEPRTSNQKIKIKSCRYDLDHDKIVESDSNLMTHFVDPKWTNEIKRNVAASKLYHDIVCFELDSD